MASQYPPGMVMSKTSKRHSSANKDIGCHGWMKQVYGTGAWFHLPHTSASSAFFAGPHVGFANIQTQTMMVWQKPMMLCTGLV